MQSREDRSTKPRKHSEANVPRRQAFFTGYLRRALPLSRLPGVRLHSRPWSSAALTSNSVSDTKICTKHNGCGRNPMGGGDWGSRRWLLKYILPRQDMSGKVRKVTKGLTEDTKRMPRGPKMTKATCYCYQFASDFILYYIYLYTGFNHNPVLFSKTLSDDGHTNYVKRNQVYLKTQLEAGRTIQ